MKWWRRRIVWDKYQRIIVRYSIILVRRNKFRISYYDHFRAYIKPCREEKLPFIFDW
jgi:hypothetical protein